MDKKAQTIDTYNKSAQALGTKFDAAGARITNIEEVFTCLGKENPKVVEIGCGNGRDAVEILKRTSDYLGIDISEELIRLAREKVPHGRFEVVDIIDFEFPKKLDAVFAFASLIHVNKEEFRTILERIYDVLNPGGVIYLSLKQSDAYEEVTKEDEFGVRTYYHYSPEDIQKIAPKFVFVKNEIQEIRGQKWLEVILQKGV
jgi:SAM-dependent methyltransferase